MGLVLPIVARSRTFTRHREYVLVYHEDEQLDEPEENFGCGLKLCAGRTACCRVARSFGSEIGGLYTHGSLRNHQACKPRSRSHFASLCMWSVFSKITLRGVVYVAGC